MRQNMKAKSKKDQLVLHIKHRVAMQHRHIVIVIIHSPGPILET